jgi:hypothetical protein
MTLLWYLNVKDPLMEQEPFDTIRFFSGFSGSEEEWQAANSVPGSNWVVVQK